MNISLNVSRNNFYHDKVSKITDIRIRNVGSYLRPLLGWNPTENFYNTISCTIVQLGIMEDKLVSPVQHGSMVSRGLSGFNHYAERR